MRKWPPDRIILVDDESIDNWGHARVIKRSGFEGDILTFGSAEQALAYLSQPDALPAQLMFVDINMPRMDGFELLARAAEVFGEDFSPSVVIMLTTSLDPKDQARARECEYIKSYINKPLTRDTFETILNTLGAAHA